MIEKIVLRLLGLKSLSSFELRKKLTRRGFAAAEIETVLNKYIDRGFINDRELAERRAELYKKKGYGPLWVSGKLKTQGLKMISYSRDEQRAVLEKWMTTPAFVKKEKNQQIAALQRKGFELEVIFSVIKD